MNSKKMGGGGLQYKVQQIGRRWTVEKLSVREEDK